MPRRRKSKRDDRPQTFWGLSPFAFAALTGIVLLALLAAFLLGQIYIFVRNDRPEVVVPNLVGMSFSSAKETARKVGLNLLENEVKYHDEIDKDHIIQHIPPEGSRVKAGRTIYLAVSLGKRDIEAPNVMGMDIDEARAELEKLGLRVGETQGKFSDDAPLNTVINQVPRPGALVAKGESIRLTYSKGPSLRSIEMPDLTGMSLEAALTELDNFNLNVSRITRIYSASASKETVSSQAPVPGRLVRRASEVILTLTLPTHMKKLGERVFSVVLNVPASEEGTEVRIIKNDLNETKEVYREVIKGPARIEKRIEAYGSTKVSIYFDGKLIREETF